MAQIQHKFSNAPNKMIENDKMLLKLLEFRKNFSFSSCDYFCRH